MPKVVVLGGYGLIGNALMRGLRDAGFQVLGVGRSHIAAMAADPGADWLTRDIPSITADEWRQILQGVDAVVNASGALQDGARDDLQAIHVTATRRLVDACAGLSLRIVQISAADVAHDAATGFLLAQNVGWPLIEGWLGLSLLLYVFVGVLWLPVVWMQNRMRNLAIAARDEGRVLPLACHRLFRLWFACGVPAVLAMLGIIWLMLIKPVF